MNVDLSSESLSALAPYPPPWPLAAGYDRHDPDIPALRSAVLDVGAALDWASLGWAELIRQLTALGRADVPLSRLAEGHIDALRILRQAGREPVPGAGYGVWASRSQQTGVRGRWEAETLILDGTIRFASGAGVLDRALVPVWTSADTHLLVDLAVSGLAVDAGRWATTAMAVTRSHTVVVAEVAIGVEDVVGPPNFYLARPGFFPGGVGVAACWAGGAARVVDLTQARLHDPVGATAARLGRIRVLLAAASSILQVAAARLDELTTPASADEDQLHTVSTEARAGVATAVHGVLDEAQRVAGPAGLAFDVDLTRAVHDLRLYALQQNADADEAYLGALPD